MSYDHQKEMGKIIDNVRALVGINRRDVMLGVGVAAVALAAPAMAQKTPCPGPGPDTLSAAGSLLLFAHAEHGADGLRQALAALAMQASGGC